MKQCKTCPWRVASKTADIPGYCERKHQALRDTIAERGSMRFLTTIKLMACHYSTEGDDRVCVGWAANQLGAGNNISLRLYALRQQWPQLKTIGKQHETFEDTLP